MQKTLDLAVWYLDTLERQIVYRLRVFAARGSLPLVVATAVAENPGVHIGALSSELATDVYQRYLASASEGFRWIEQYAADTAREQFEEVVFDLTGARTLAETARFSRSREEIYGLLGTRLHDSMPST